MRARLIDLLEKHTMRRFLFLLLGLLLIVNVRFARAQVVINEIAYDDGSTDDLEFIELYNAGTGSVDISGWFIAGQDGSGANFQPQATYTVPASTTLAAGGYYVIGNPSVPNVNFVINPGAAGVIENDAELTELRDSGGNLIDAMIYESNKGPSGAAGYGALSAAQLAEVGPNPTPGYFGNYFGADLPTLIPAGTLSRFTDGLDTNNNGRDFGFRPGTPGLTNSPLPVTNYVAPDVSASSSYFLGDPVNGWAYGFDAPPRVVEVDSEISGNPVNRNTNVIPAPPTGDNRAIMTFDPAGGGNGYSTAETFASGEGSFDLWVYFDTTDLPQNTNGSGTAFRGSEYSYFNLGGSDSVSNVSNLNGPGFANTVNGSTGLLWVYEKTQPLNPSDTNPATNGVIEKLYLVDAGDGGPNDINNTNEWTILQTIDLSTTPSGWYRLSLSVGEGGGELVGDENADGTVDAADYVALRKAGLATDDFEEHFGESGGGGGPNGFARFDDQEFTFSTTSQAGAFGTGYRENLQLGAVGVPYTIMRPPTFVQYEAVEVGGSGTVPEPSALALAALAGVALIGWRKRLM
jgi:hypothetical protein